MGKVNGRHVGKVNEEIYGSLPFPHSSSLLHPRRTPITRGVRRLHHRAWFNRVFPLPTVPYGAFPRTEVISISSGSQLAASLTCLSNSRSLS